MTPKLKSTVNQVEGMQMFNNKEPYNKYIRLPPADKQTIEYPDIWHIQHYLLLEKRQ